MKLAKSIKVINDFEERFNEVLSDELIEHQYDMPLEKFCENGGFPEPESIEIDIEKIIYIYESNKITVEFSVSFSETVAVSCADYKRENRNAVLKYEIDKQSGKFNLLEDTALSF